eukprot:3584176-Alexandrium_andersonii.AAC.1
MSVVGEPAEPEPGTEDVGEEMRFLCAAAAPATLGGESEVEAVDLARALSAVGATPSEARATVAEGFSPPRAAAQAE